MDAPWDCIVIGGGAAGLSAALALGRARRRILLLDAGGQSNLRADHIGGVLGQDGRTAAALYARGREELAAYPTVECREALATRARREADGTFALAVAHATRDHHDDGAESPDRTERARNLILATGTDYRFPAIAGLAERFGGAAFHCPFCHGWEHRDGDLGVLDGSPVGVDRALMLRAWSDRVTLYTNGATELADDARARLAAGGVALEERAIVALEGDGAALAQLSFADGADPRACTGLLVAVELEQRGTLITDLGVERHETGWKTIAVDMMGRTDVPGVFAAGDAATANPSVASAMATGTAAGAGVVHALMVPPAVPAPAAF